MKNNVIKAFESAEQEIQDKEIESLKKIIKNLLQSKKDKEDKKREIENEISILKKTIDDFKAGRLDKVKEMVEKDEIAHRIVPITITIINQPELRKPWTWRYGVEWNVNNGYRWGNSNNILTYNATANNLCNLAGDTTTYVTGTNAVIYTTGTYEVNGKIINL